MTSLLAVIDVDNFDAILRLVVDGVSTGQPASVVVPGLLVLLVHLLRMGVGAFGERFPKLQAVFSHPFALWLLPTLVSVAGAILTVTVAGLPVTVAVVVKAVLLGLAANGTFNGIRKAQEALPTKEEAIDNIKKTVGPQP